MKMDKLYGLVKDLRELYRMADEIESEIDTIESEIKAYMDTSGMDTINGTDYKVTWKSYTRARLDTAALKRENPELIARYTTNRAVRSFCVT